jgi:hypothetical protein
MRPILAVVATALAVTLATSTVAFAQKKTTDAATASRAQARGSLNASYNRCVSLARNRGFNDSDIGGKNSPARRFVISCMQGKQH